MLDLSGKVALVTGGSKGIGKATSQALARAGARVAIDYSSDRSSAEHLVQELGSDNAYAVQADAGTLQGVQDMMKATISRFGRLDIIVASAGITPIRHLENTTEADFDTAIRVNVKGPYFLAQKVASVMAAGSRIVFISSSLCHASTVRPDDLLYCCTKGAIEQMTRVLSKDLAAKGICVNAIAPGPVGDEHFLKGKSEALVQAIANSSPHGRLAEPEEIADTIVFLCAPESRWVTGQILRVNGGMV